MAIEVTVEQIIAFGGILGAGIAAYWKLKGKVDALTRRDVEIEKDIEDNDKEIQKIWSKMLTTEGHNKECEIMNLKIKEQIRVSGDAITEKVEETMTDFREQMGKMFEEMTKKIEANNKRTV